MAINEQRRHQLYESLQEVIGVDETSTLMEYLPPVGWSDVARQKDLTEFESRTELRFAAIDQRFDSLEGRVDIKLESLENKIMGEIQKAISGQTRSLFLAFLGANATAVGIAFTLAKMFR